MDRRGAAFTLIELLVVIVIISILAALLFPVFNSAKHQANNTKEVASLHQLGMAFQIYLADNDDFYPTAWDGFEGTGKTGGWIFYSTYHRARQAVFDPSRGSVFPYIKSTDFFVDPLDKSKGFTHNSFAISSFVVPFNGSGYNNGKASSDIPNLGATMLLGEEATGFLGPSHPFFDQGSDDGYFNYPGDHFASWHPEGTLIIYTDSRAKIVPAQNQYNQTICGQVDECDENGTG